MSKLKNAKGQQRGIFPSLYKIKISKPFLYYLLIGAPFIILYGILHNMYFVFVQSHVPEILDKFSIYVIGLISFVFLAVMDFLVERFRDTGGNYN